MTQFLTSGIITHLLNWLNIKFGPKIPIFTGIMTKKRKKIHVKKWPFWGPIFENCKFSPKRDVFRLTNTSINLKYYLIQIQRGPYHSPK